MGRGNTMSSKINAISTGVGGLATSADASGILEIQTNDTTAITVDGSQVVSFGNNFGTVAGLPSYQCRAWVNFNGTGTVAIRASGNVSSITDNGVGDYRINFATEMPDINYSTLVSNGNDSVADLVNLNYTAAGTEAPVFTLSIRLVSQQTGTGARDQKYMNVAIFR